MAYPTVSAPYGFKPYNLIGGRVYSGSTRQIPIAIGNATAIYTGDIVIMSSNGTVTIGTLTATAVQLGIEGQPGHLSVSVIFPAAPAMPAHAPGRSCSCRSAHTSPD